MHDDSLKSHRLYPGVPDVCGKHGQTVDSPPLQNPGKTGTSRGKRIGSLLGLERVSVGYVDGHEGS